MVCILAYNIEVYAWCKSLPGGGRCALLFEDEKLAMSWAVMQIIQGGEITRQIEGWVYDGELYYSEAEVLTAWRQDLIPGEFLDVLPLALMSNCPIDWEAQPIAPEKHYTDADIRAANLAAAEAMRRAS